MRKPGHFKDFGSKASALRAVEKAGLQNVPHNIQINRDGSSYRFEPVFTPDLQEDRDYIRDVKGFKAVVPL